MRTLRTSGKQLGSRWVSRAIYVLGEGEKEGLRGQGPGAWGTGVSGVFREVGDLGIPWGLISGGEEVAVAVAVPGSCGWPEWGEAFRARWRAGC